MATKDNWKILPTMVDMMMMDKNKDWDCPKCRRSYLVDSDYDASKAIFDLVDNDDTNARAQEDMVVAAAN